MDTLDIQVNERAAKALLEGLTPEAMMRAWRRTLRKSARWLQRLALKSVSAETKIALAVLRKRVRYYERSADEGKLWAGLNPFAVDQLNPRNTATGIVAAGLEYPGAWFWKKKQLVMKRVGKSRLPIKRVYLDDEEEVFQVAAANAFMRLTPKLEKHLLAILEKEIWAEIK